MPEPEKLEPFLTRRAPEPWDVAAEYSDQPLSLVGDIYPVILSEATSLTGGEVNDIAKAVFEAVKDDHPDELEWPELSTELRNKFRDMARAAISRFKQIRKVSHV